MRVRWPVMLTFVSVTLVTALASGATPAAASCTGPSIRTTPGPVDRGAVLVVDGTGFGDQCYDTGIPSGAHGGLGDPIMTIAIYVVQDGVDHVVARGSADDRYAFQVEIEVPPTLHPGPAQLVAATPDQRTSRLRPVELIITEDEPRPTSGIVATLRPGTAAVPVPPGPFGGAPSTVPVDDDPADDGGGPIARYVALAATGLLAIGWIVRRRIQAVGTER